jgi:hypothetical protein
MLEEVAREVVDGLRARGVDAHLTEGGGDLSAEVLQDGDLVGMVPEVQGSGELSAEELVHVIARADYSEPEGHERATDPPPEPALPIEGGLFRRFRDGFRYR